MKLYKKDSKGKLRELDIYADDGHLYQVSGLVDGKKVTNSKLCKPKNVGKKNETTSIQQAQKEAESLITKKLSEGYFKTIKEAENYYVILPMLAKVYNKEKHKIDWSKPVFVQPKLDGMRCHGYKDKMLSRKNKEIDTLNHIQQTLKNINSNYILDGELYAHGLSFQENMKLIKKYREKESEKIKYHVYDLVMNESFEVRYDTLMRLVNDIDDIELVPTYRITSESEMLEYHKKFLSQGYEGTIIRWGKAGYESNKRSSHLLKYKDFKDMTAIVKDIIPMDAYPKQGLVVCDEFIATPKMSHKEKEELLANKDKYIGQIAEIRYFEETDDGKPRFPVCVGFRLDK